MHLVVIAWLYVALMMAIAEATNTTGTVLGAIVTFVLYGLLPVALVVYLMATPARRRALKAREAAEREAAVRAHAQADPEACSSAEGDAAANLDRRSYCGGFRAGAKRLWGVRSFGRSGQRGAADSRAGGIAAGPYFCSFRKG